MRPWDGLVPEEELRVLEGRGNSVDRKTRFAEFPALIVVDMTRSFTDPGYAASCYDTGGAEATEANKVVLDAARRAGIPVFFTKALQTTPGEFLPAERKPRLRQLMSTPDGRPEGNEVGELLAPQHGEIVIGKPKPSAFYGTALDAYLNYFRVDSLIVTGMVTSGCVAATVADGCMRNYHVIVVEEAVADYSVWAHRTSLLIMHVKWADVAHLDEVVDYLHARTGLLAQPV